MASQASEVLGIRSDTNTTNQQVDELPDLQSHLRQIEDCI